MDDPPFYVCAYHKRRNTQGIKRLIQPTCYQDALDASLSLSEGGTMLQKMLDNISGLLPEPLLYPCQRGKTSSCYNLGYKSFVQGIKVRPEFPHRDAVVGELMRLLAADSTPYQSTPKISTVEGRQHHFEGTWEARQSKAKLRMINVRKIRRRQDQ